MHFFKASDYGVANNTGQCSSQKSLTKLIVLHAPVLPTPPQDAGQNNEDTNEDKKACKIHQLYIRIVIVRWQHDRQSMIHERRSHQEESSNCLC